MSKFFEAALSKFLGGWQAYAAVFALGAALSAYPTWYVTDAVMGRQLAVERAARAADHATQLEAARALEAQHAALETALWGHLAAIQNQADKEAENAKAESDRLRADYDAGRLGLWIEACRLAASAGDAAPHSAAAESCDAGPVLLTRGSGQAVLHIRDGIEQDRRTIRACQADAAAIRAIVNAAAH